MIIYGEALEAKAPPNSEEGIEADDKFPEVASSLLKHATAGMKIERH